MLLHQPVRIHISNKAILLFLLGAMVTGVCLPLASITAPLPLFLKYQILQFDVVSQLDRDLDEQKWQKQQPGLALEELAQLEALDNGKSVVVAGVADVPLAVDLFRYMAGMATKLEGKTIPASFLVNNMLAPGSQFHSYTLREPIGVVGQIIPWNFPLLMLSWKIAPALAAGCSIIIKPAELHNENLPPTHSGIGSILFPSIPNSLTAEVL